MQLSSDSCVCSTFLLLDEKKGRVSMRYQPPAGARQGAEAPCRRRLRLVAKGSCRWCRCSRAFGLSGWAAKGRSEQGPATVPCWAAVVRVPEPWRVAGLGCRRDCGWLLGYPGKAASRVAGRAGSATAKSSACCVLLLFGGPPSACGREVTVVKGAAMQRECGLGGKSSGKEAEEDTGSL